LSCRRNRKTIIRVKGTPVIPVPDIPPSEIEGLLDQVKATAIALLAMLQEKEKTLCGHANSMPTPGVARGLSDIRALRIWADRTLRTIQVLENGRAGEIDKLLEELGEFAAIVR
jgi:hypothetical protein